MHEPKHDNLHKELDLIQDVIKRMAQNSFQIRGWMIGILSVMVALQNKMLLSGADQFSPLAAAFLLLPVLSFWYLDAFSSAPSACIGRCISGWSRTVRIPMPIATI